MDFYSNFVRLCAEKGISPTAAATAAGVNKSTVSRWKSGAAPSYLMIMKIAEYFHVDPSRSHKILALLIVNVAQNEQKLSQIRRREPGINT